MVKIKNKQKYQKATFAMGCFWQPDYIFSKIRGVVETAVGYTGCNKECKNPTYEDVCSDTTGCAETIQIIFNPKQISYNKILDIFWTHHNPTTLNYQGPDYGTQYRSAIFYHNEKQKSLALKSKIKWEKLFIDKSKKIVTQIAPASEFYKAEDYHQKYLMKTGRVCHISEKVFK